MPSLVGSFINCPGKRFYRWGCGFGWSSYRIRSRPMVTIYLEAGWEKVTPATPFATFTQPLLYHQVRTLEALKSHDLALNSYNTGTGKTVASLLYLFELN